MFTIFKKKQNINQQIYQDVYSAQDLLLKEAESILSKKPMFDEEKASRLLDLHTLGFTQTEEVKKLMEQRKEKKEHEKILEYLNYYQLHYPSHKFITKEAVKRICDKYGLLLAEVNHYVAEIPDKNQKEIVNFKVKEEDVRIESLRAFGSLVGIRRSGEQERFRNLWESSYNESFKAESLRRAGDSAYLIGYDPYQESDMTAATKANLLATNKPIVPKKWVSGRELKIVAPRHKLDTVGNTEQGHLLIDDPIVLQPVKGGYLIVSSWGLEASDPEVVNPKSN